MADIFIYDGHISSSDGFNIQVSESNAMIVSHSFNITDGARSHIGIGGAPHNSYALHLSGSGIRVAGAGGFTTTNHLFFEGAGNHYIKHNGGTAASDNIIFRFSDNEDVLTISGDGQVGIGTTAPLRTFEVAGTGATLRVGPDYLTSVGTTDRDYIELQADNSDTKIVSPNERFHIENPGGMGADGHIILTAAGGIGIGTTSPTAKLEVIGDISGSVGTTGSFDGAVKVKDRLAIGAPNLASTSDLIIGDGTANVNVTLFGDEDSATQASLWFGDVTSGASPHYGGTGFVFDGNANHLTIRRGGSTDNLFAIDVDNGDTAIGKTSGDPAAKLEVFGDMIVGDGAANIISSPQYFSGFAGSGFRIGSGSNGTFAEFDRLSVRGEFQVQELVANQVRATNGSLWVSNAGKIISASQEGNTAASFSMFFETGSDTLDHGFVRGDLIRAQKFDGSNVFQSNMIVVSRSDSGSIIASLEAGSHPPTASFNYVRIGSETDTDRDAAIYITATDNNAPYIDIIDGVDSHAAFNQSDKIKVRLGRLDGVTDADVGGALTGYGLYSENVFLKGTIAASAGDIGGFGINETSISSSNDNLILRSTGQITASDFLFDGSGTIDGNVTIGEGVTIGGQLSVGANPKLPSDQDLVIYYSFNQATGSLVQEHVGTTDADGNNFNLDYHTDPLAIGNLISAGGSPQVTYTSESISGTGIKRLGHSGTQLLLNTTSSISSSIGGPSGSLSFWMNKNYDSASGDPTWAFWGENGETQAIDEGEYFRASWGGSPSSLIVEAVHNGDRDFFIDDNAATGYQNSISASLAAANSGSTGWVHWVFTWGSGSGTPDSRFSIYINGELNQYASLSGSLIDFVPSSSRLSIAAQTTDDVEIDEVRVYNKAITAQEVRGLYLSPGGTNQGTTITGDQIQTGQIKSNNWNNSTEGSMIDLTNGRMHLGGLEDNAKLHFDGTNLSVAGTVSASAGNIGGWTVDSDKFVDGSDTIRLEPNGTYVISSSEFQVDAEGALTASKALVSGEVTTSQALIGGWTVDSGSISGNDAKLDAAGKLSLSSSNFTGTGIQLENNSGDPRAYIGDGSKTGSFLQFDGTDGLRLGPGVSLAFGGTTVPGQNLVDDFATLAIQDPAVNSTLGNFARRGEESDNEISMSVGPHGISEKVWVASPDSDGNDGGYRTSWFEVDPSSTYQFSTYVQWQNYATGSLYFGNYVAGTEQIDGWVQESDWPDFNAYTGSLRGAPSSGSVVRHDNDVFTSNPYFLSNQFASTLTQSVADGGLGGELDRWYLMIGYIHASESVYGGANLGGLYDTVTGRKLKTLTDFRFTSESKFAVMRTFHYKGFLPYADDDTTAKIWAKPGVRKVLQATTDISAFIDIGSAIATGQYEGSSTFITSTSIFSPNIAGTDGYISNKLTVGEANDGVTLDGTNKKIYIGAGNWKNSDTAFIARDSQSELIPSPNFNSTDGWTTDGNNTDQDTAAGTFTFLGNGVFSYVQPTNDTVQPGVSYKIAVTIDSISAGNLKINDPSAGYPNVGSAAGTHIIDYIPSAGITKPQLYATNNSATVVISQYSIKEISVFSLGDKFAWDGETLQITGSISLTAGDASASIAQLKIDSGSFVSTISSSTEGLQSSITQNENSITAAVAVNTAQASSLSALEITTGSIEASVSALNETSGTLEGSVSQLELATGSINLSVQTIQGQVTQSQFNNLDFSQGYIGWNYNGNQGNHTGLTSIGSNLDSLFSGSMDTHLAGIAYTSGTLAQGKVFEVVSGSNLSGSRFGRALEVRANENGGQQWIFASEAVPVDTNRVYQGRVRVRMAHVGDNGKTKSQFYAGFVCLDEFGNNISEDPGTHRYFTVAGSDILDSDPYTWNEYSGSISRTTTEAGGAGSEDLSLIGSFIGNNGFASGDPSTHNVFKTGTKFVRPMMIFNYQSINATEIQNGTETLPDTAMQVDGFTIEDVTPSIQSSASISITDTQVQTNVSNIAGNTSTITQNASDISLTVATASDITNLAINPQGVQISGSSLEFSGSSFFFGIGTPADAATQEGAFVSGSGGNIEISSSNFHLQASGSAIFSGSVSASQGDIAGWSLTKGRFASDNIALSSSNEEVSIGPNKEIILSGSGEGQLAGGAIAFDKFGNLSITNADLIISGTSFLRDDISDSANSKWVVMDDATEVNYATYEPNTQITITRIDGTIVSSSLITEQYFVGNFASADINQGDIIDADKPIQVVTKQGGNGVLPFNFMSRRIYGRDARSGYTRTFSIFTPFGSGSLTASFQSSAVNDGAFDGAVMFKSISGNSFTIMSGSGINDDDVVWRVESTEPVLVFTSGSSGVDHCGWAPPSKRVVSMEATDYTEVLSVPNQTFETVRAESIEFGTNLGYYVRSNHPFMNEVSGDGNGSDKMSGLPVEAMGDTYIIPHETENYQIIAIQPTFIRAYKMQGSGQLEFYAEYDMTGATEDNPQGIAVGSNDDEGGSGIHDSGMYFTATAPFGLRTNTSGGDEYWVLGYKKSQADIYPGSTAISGDRIRTGKVQSNNWNNNDAGSLLDLNVGTVHLGGSGSNANFYVNEAGDLQITGSVNAASGRFTGDIQAENILANSGSIAGFTIDSDKIQKYDDSNGATQEMYVTMGASETTSATDFVGGRGFSVYLTNDLSDIGETKIVRLGQIGTKDTTTYTGVNTEYGLQIVKRTGTTSYKDIVRFGASEQIIGGFTIDSDTISVGDPKLLELKATTTAGDFIISASDFQVNTAGAFTASAGIIEGDTIMRGKLEVLDPTGAQTFTLFARGADYTNIGTHPARVQGGNDISETSFTIGHNLVILSESAAGVLEKRHKSAYDTHNTVANGDTLAGILMGTSTYTDVNGNATTLEDTDVVIVVSHDANKISTALYGALTSSGGTNPTAKDINGDPLPLDASSGQSRQPYALIGQKGLGHGNGFEANGLHDQANTPAGSAVLTAFYKNNLISANSSPGSEIVGDRIKTGFIQSNNWTGETGEKGTLFDLNEGRLQIRSGSNDYFHIDPAGNKAEIAGWTFNQEKFYSNPSNEVRGINMNKNKGIRGRNATQAFFLSSSNQANYTFQPQNFLPVADEGDNLLLSP